MVTILGETFDTYREAAEAIYVSPGVAAEVSRVNRYRLLRYAVQGRFDGHMLYGRQAKYGPVRLLRLSAVLAVEIAPVNAHSRWTAEDLLLGVSLFHPYRDQMFDKRRYAVLRLLTRLKQNRHGEIRIVRPTAL